MYGSPGRLSRWLSATFFGWMMASVGIASWAAPALTQEKINEAAAYQLDAYLKLKDAPASRPSPESPAAYTHRLRGYVVSMERAYDTVEAARSATAHIDIPPANASHWKRIGSNARHLASLISVARKSLDSPSHESAAAVLPTAKKLLWELYADLRDLRP